MMKRRSLISRRQFLKQSSMGIAAASSLPVISSCVSPLETPVTSNVVAGNEKNPGKDRGPAPPEDSEPPVKLIDRRQLGKTGLNVSLLAFGGGSFFMTNEDGVWELLLERAIQAGVNYFDTAWNYGDGESEIRFGEVLNEYRQDLYIATKLDAREGDESKQQFEGCLNRLKMDYVDVLMMHAISKNDDITTIENGVWKEMTRYKEEGSAKFIGFSVMLEEDLPVARSLIEKFDVDVVLGIINPVNHFGNCSDLIPLIREKDIGLMSMKALRDIVSTEVSAKELIFYALDKEGVAGTIIGHVGLANLEENISTVQEYSNVSCLRKDWAALEEKLEKFTAVHTPAWTLPGYRDGRCI